MSGSEKQGNSNQNLEKWSHQQAHFDPEHTKESLAIQQPSGHISWEAYQGAGWWSWPHTARSNEVCCMCPAAGRGCQADGVHSQEGGNGLKQKGFESRQGAGSSCRSAPLAGHFCSCSCSHSCSYSRSCSRFCSCSAIIQVQVPVTNIPQGKRERTKKAGEELASSKQKRKSLFQGFAECLLGTLEQYSHQSILVFRTGGIQSLFSL